MKVHIFLAVLLLPACLALPMEHFDGRIVGGGTASNGQFRHQVSVRRNDLHFCGGSIISSTTILTAAHCIYNTSPQGMTVVAGTNSLNSGGAIAKVSRALYHDSYNPHTLLNDIAILKLVGSLPIGDTIQIVHLNYKPVHPGETLTLSGWGLTSYPGNIPNLLQYINLRSIDLQTCANQLVGVNPIDVGHVCTYSPPGQGACKGDSGGPLINANDKQVGVVSWGIPCANGRPDVFTSVAFYYNWIQQAIQTLQ